MRGAGEAVDGPAPAVRRVRNRGIRPMSVRFESMYA